MANGLRPFVLDRNIRHFLWYGGVAGDGLRSVGEEAPPLIQERVLYPAHRPLRAGASFAGGSGLYLKCLYCWPHCSLPILDNAAFALRPLCVAWDLGWCDHDYARWDAHNALYNTVSIPYTCSAHRLLSGVGAPTGPPRSSDSSLRPTPIEWGKAVFLYLRGIRVLGSSR
jgi:hypothetical protein